MFLIKILNSKGKIYYSVVFAIFLIGLLRLFMLNSMGNVDMEFWRAWMYKIEKGNIFNIYSINTHDLKFFKNLSIKIPLEDDFFIFKGIDPNYFEANMYLRKFYPIVQPPIFYVDLYFVNAIKKIIDVNDYFLLNIVNIFWTLLLVYILYLILKKTALENPFLKALILIWLNPIFILNPVALGFRDIFASIFVIISIYFLIKNFYLFSGICIALGLLTKPQILFTIFVLLILIRKNKIINFLLGILLILCLLLVLYYQSGYLYGLIASLIMVSATTVWFPTSISIFTPLSFLQNHQNYLITNDYTKLLRLIDFLSYHIQLFSIFGILFLCCVVIYLRLNYPLDNLNLYSIEVFYMSLFVYVLRPNSQPNHYFVLSIFWILSLAKYDKYFWSKLLIILCFVIQDLGYNGFGRNSFFVGLGSQDYINLIFLLSVFVSLIMVQIAYIYFKNKDYIRI